ncbi:MAG TPA: FecR domain-containing protein, partial [Gemmatimonadaceae bacterium]|nr:FecR domain-containing protein [Gemmatimonadaceae bacterium]
MNTDDPIDWFKLTAYFAGECTAEERDALEQWLQAAPERRHLLDQLRMVWAARHQRPAVEYGREGVIAHVMAMVQQWKAKEIALPQSARPALKGARVLGKQPLRRRLFKAHQSMWPILAVAPLLLLVLVAGWRIGQSHRGTTLSVPVSTYVTGNGERANITLPDGNLVSLNVASQVDVPANYLAGNHTLRLNGEALFTVRHQTRTPFVVVAGTSTTRVLGTTFMIRHYREDTTAIVAVHDGKVVVSTHPRALKPIVLTAGRQLTLARTGATQLIQAPSGAFSFATGVLTLADVPLTAAIPTLDRWYNVDIRLGSDRLAEQRITGDCPAGSISDAVAILAATFNV